MLSQASRAEFLRNLRHPDIGARRFRSGNDPVLCLNNPDGLNSSLRRKTLVIWGGEFGRTVYCQGDLSEKNYGREHKRLTYKFQGRHYRLTDIHGDGDQGFDHLMTPERRTCPSHRKSVELPSYENLISSHSRLCAADRRECLRIACQRR